MRGTPTPSGSSAPTYAQVADALAAAAGAETTIAGAAVISMLSTLVARAGGLSLVAGSSSDVSNTVQESPLILWQGQVRVSGANRVMSARVLLVPRTSGALDLLFQYDAAGTGSFNTAFRYTTSTASQFTGALEASGISLSTNTGLFFDSDNSRIARGGSGDLNIYAELTSNALPAWLARSKTAAGNAAPFRFYCFGTSLGSATQKLFEIGINVASAFSGVLAVMGDGVIENPDLHIDATVKTGDFTAAVKTAHMVDLSGSAITATIPAAAATNAGWPIEISQTVAGTADLILAPASGTIEGQASVTLAGLASAPLRTVRLRSYGVGTGSPGWKIL